MTVKQPALFMQARVDHSAEDMRRWMSAMFGDKSGIFGSGDLAVTARGTPDRSVDVAGGRAIIEGEATVYQGVYFVENRGATNVPLGAADSTNGRIDLLVARVRDEQYTGGTTGSPWEIVVVQGTAAPSPSPPARPANSIELARVSVPSLAGRNPTVINPGDITDRRYIAGQGLVGTAGGSIYAANKAELDTTYSEARDGTKAYTTSDNKSWVRVNAAWIWDGPQGILGYISSSVQIGPTNGDTQTALGLTLVLPGTRTFKLSSGCRAMVCGTSSCGYLTIRETSASNALLVEGFFPCLAPYLASSAPNVEATLTRPAGTYTFNVWIRPDPGGTVSMQCMSYAPGYLRAEDLGPA